MRLGSRSGGRALVVYLRIPAGEVPAGEPAVAGVVVGKKQVRHAVDRNRVKRRLRHLLADVLPTLPPGSRLVVRGLGPAASMTSTELRAALDRSLAAARRKQAATPGRGEA